MSKMSDIRNGLMAWDNQFPLNSPETPKDEILWEEIRRRAKIFESDAVENVRILLSHIELLERQLELYENGRKLTFQEILQRDLGSGM